MPGEIDIRKQRAEQQNHFKRTPAAREFSPGKAECELDLRGGKDVGERIGEQQVSRGGKESSLVRNPDAIGDANQQQI